MTETTPVQLAVTITDPATGEATTVIDTALYYKYARSAVEVALDQVNRDVANNLRLQFEAANAAAISAAQAPIEAAQAAAREAFQALDSVEA